MLQQIFCHMYSICRDFNAFIALCPLSFFFWHAVQLRILMVLAIMTNRSPTGALMNIQQQALLSFGQHHFLLQVEMLVTLVSNLFILYFFYYYLYFQSECEWAHAQPKFIKISSNINMKHHVNKNDLFTVTIIYTIRLRHFKICSPKHIPCINDWMATKYVITAMWSSAKIRNSKYQLPHIYKKKQIIPLIKT